MILERRLLTVFLTYNQFSPDSRKQLSSSWITKYGFPLVISRYWKAFFSISTEKPGLVIHACRIVYCAVQLILFWNNAREVNDELLSSTTSWLLNKPSSGVQAFVPGMYSAAIVTSAGWLMHMGKLEWGRILLLTWHRLLDCFVFH